MKVENFEAAVHFYGKAIELNPANAVYYCNRYHGAQAGGVAVILWVSNGSTAVKYPASVRQQAGCRGASVVAVK